MLTQILPYSLGFFLALAMCYAARYMPYEKEYRYWWVIAVCVVASFPSMPLSMGDMAGFWYEIYAVGALGLLLVVSWRPGLWLALVFFGHGCWDLVHISAHLTIQKPLWVSQLCVPYDWMIAAYLVWRTRSSRVS